MSGALLEVLGGILAAVLAAGAVLSGSTRGRAGFALGALLVTPVLLASTVWETSAVREVRDRPELLAAALAVGLVVVAVLAVVLARRPSLVAPLAVGVLAFRVPIGVGEAQANLLVPLYLVIAGATLAAAVPRLRAPDDDAPRAAGTLERLLCLALVLFAVQVAWSTDRQDAIQHLAFFYVPFALLFARLRELELDGRVVRSCATVVAVLAVALVAIGFVEVARQRLFLTSDATAQFDDVLRVSSLFFDPNIFGRFLAVALLGVATAILWRPLSSRGLAGTALLAAWLFAGLVVTLSQSSFAALLAGLVVLAALRLGVRPVALAAGVAAVVTVVAVLAAPGALRLDFGDSGSLDRATSGRAELISGGLGLWASAPVLGHGSGSFSREYRRAEDVSAEKATTASHTIPVTVAAEQGVVGLLAYLALLVAAFLRLGRGAAGDGTRAFVLAAFAALVVHTMLYASFLEDPLTWTLLAFGIALAPPREG